MLSLWSEELADRAQSVSSLTRQRQPWLRATDTDYNDLKAISSWICLPFILLSFSNYVHSGPRWTSGPWRAGSAIWKDIKSLTFCHQQLIPQGLARARRGFRMSGAPRTTDRIIQLVNYIIWVLRSDSGVLCSVTLGKSWSLWASVSLSLKWRGIS